MSEEEEKLVDQDKLIDILKTNKVRISTKGNICLNDFVKNVVKSKNPDQYVKRQKCDKIDIKGFEYITPDDCIHIIKKSKFKTCKELYAEIELDDEDEVPTIIDIESQIFKFEGHKFVSFFVEKEDGDWDVWIKGSQVAKYLGYTDDKQVVRDNVDEDNICTFSELCELFDLVSQYKSNIKIDKKTKFINYNGFIELVLKSNKPKSIKLAEELGIDVKYKFLRKEIDIVHHLDMFCIGANIKSSHQFAVKKNNKSRYFVDYYLPEYNLVIEIDEFGHINRDKKYEKRRVKIIKDKISCSIIRCNPDDPKFSLAELIGQITQFIVCQEKIKYMSQMIDIYKDQEKMRDLESQFRKSENYKLELKRDGII